MSGELPDGATYDPTSRNGPGPTPGAGDPRDGDSDDADSDDGGTRSSVPTVTGHRSGYQVVVDCPYCDDTHRHGLTDDLRNGGVSERLADCRFGGNYLIDGGRD